MTKNGMTVGVMMTPERYEGLLETIEILADPKIIKALRASERGSRTGKVYVHMKHFVDSYANLKNSAKTFFKNG